MDPPLLDTDNTVQNLLSKLRDDELLLHRGRVDRELREEVPSGQIGILQLKWRLDVIIRSWRSVVRCSL